MAGLGHARLTARRRGPYSAAMRIGTVSQLWRYPVKSMGGERLAVATLSRGGIPGDRGWAVYDESRQGVTSAKRVPPIRTCAARYLTEPVPGAGTPAAEIALPAGTTLATEAAALARPPASATLPGARARSARWAPQGAKLPRASLRRGTRPRHCARCQDSCRASPRRT